MKATDSAEGSFDWIAPLYDGLARIVFGRRLQRAQGLFLELIPARASVLIVGGGTGWLLEQVLTQCQPQRIVYLEASATMLALASKRMVQRGLVGSVTFRVGDETSLTPAERFDCILTPFVLDLYPEKTLRSALIPRLHAGLKPGGLWFVTDFVNPKIGWQKGLLWVMIRFFRLTAGMPADHLADWQNLLPGAPLIREKQRAQVNGMVSAEVWRKPINQSETGSVP